MNKKIKRICKYCKSEKIVFSNKKIEYCVSCSQKKRFGTLGIQKWYKECIKCGENREFSWRKTYLKSGDLCVSCSQIKNEEHYNREYQKYKGKVWTETNKQPLNILENFEKRGKSGIENAYQLDHIISIKYGFDNKIIPEQIGNIKNLQMLPWKDNRIKSNK